MSSANHGDAHRLLLPTGTVDLVLALGVLSWLAEPTTAIKELARVTRPDGHLLVSSLNRLDLAHLPDPGRTPLLAPARSAAHLAAARLGRRDRVRPARHLGWSVRRSLRHRGLVPLRQATVGFGPLTFLGRALLAGDRAIGVDQALQRRADHHSTLLRASGRLHLILAPQARPRQNLVFAWLHPLALIREQIAHTGPITVLSAVPSDLRRRRIAQRSL